jgi:hypothetical protein
VPHHPVHGAPARRRPRKEHVKKSLLLLPIALLAVAMALTACGGGSSSSGGGEEAAIEKAIETSATSTDPSKCTEVQTEAFDENETEKSGAAAVKACEEEVESEPNPAESITVSDISENGETATAEAAIEGGSFDGQAVELEVTKEDDDWKLNEILGFTKYDAAGIASALEEQLNEEEEITPALAKCVSEGVEKMSQAEAEVMILEKNLKGLETIANGCE